MRTAADLARSHCSRRRGSAAFSKCGFCSREWGERTNLGHLGTPRSIHVAAVPGCAYFNRQLSRMSALDLMLAHTPHTARMGPRRPPTTPFYIRLISKQGADCVHSFPLFSTVSELLQVETGCTRLERQTRTARHTRLHRTSTQGLKNNTTRGTTRSRSRRPALYTRRRGVSTPAAGGPALDEHAGETGHPSCQLRAANATLGCEKDAQLGRDAE